MPKVPKPVEEELAKMLGFVDDKSIITFDEKTGVIFIGGERVVDDKLANLKSESEFMLKSELWKILNETIRHLAYETMFIKSTTYDDMRSGKMLLYHLGMQQRIMTILSAYVRRTP